jgi:hypothetical protein
MIDAWYEHDIFDMRREEGGGEVYITRQGNLNLELNLVASGNGSRMELAKGKGNIGEEGRSGGRLV